MPIESLAIRQLFVVYIHVLCLHAWTFFFFLLRFIFCRSCRLRWWFDHLKSSHLPLYPPLKAQAPEPLCAREMISKLFWGSALFTAIATSAFLWAHENRANHFEEQVHARSFNKASHHLCVSFLFFFHACTVSLHFHLFFSRWKGKLKQSRLWQAPALCLSASHFRWNVEETKPFTGRHPDLVMLLTITTGHPPPTVSTQMSPRGSPWKKKDTPPPIWWQKMVINGGEMLLKRLSAAERHRKTPPKKTCVFW